MTRPAGPTVALLLALALTGSACAGRSSGASAPPDLRAMLGTLAADSMEGRATATPGAERAARWIAERMREYGLDPGGGDGSYFQQVPFAVSETAEGRTVRLLRPDMLDSLVVGDSVVDVNVIGLVRGADPEVADEAVIVGAHYDHVGIGPAVDGDSIYNGADDDGSGVVTVLAAARALAAGEPPRRTVIFLLTTGEEQHLLGTEWYIEHPVVPMARTVADLQVEMIGRPDSLAGGPGRFWLTGYERSTMGPQLAEAGIPVVADPRPEFKFFERSDNIAFARIGIPAHTLSSYGMHKDYHQPSDEVERIDFGHLETAAETVTRAVRVLADGERPEWLPGGRPAPAPATP